MKKSIYLLVGLCLFGLGYLLGDYSGARNVCKGKDSIISRVVSKKANPVLHVYTKATCPYCVGAKELLSVHDIYYTEIDISDDTALKAEMIKKSKGRKTVPQIFVGETHIGGFDDLQTIIETFKPCKTD